MGRTGSSQGGNRYHLHLNEDTAGDLAMLILNGLHVMPDETKARLSNIGDLLQAKLNGA